MGHKVGSAEGPKVSVAPKFVTRTSASPAPVIFDEEGDSCEVVVSFDDFLLDDFFLDEDLLDDTTVGAVFVNDGDFVGL